MKCLIWKPDICMKSCKISVFKMHIILCFVYSWMISHLQIVVIFKKKLRGCQFFTSRTWLWSTFPALRLKSSYKPVKVFLFINIILTSLKWLKSMESHRQNCSISLHYIKYVNESWSLKSNWSPIEQPPPPHPTSGGPGGGGYSS